MRPTRPATRDPINRATISPIAPIDVARLTNWLLVSRLIRRAKVAVVPTIFVVASPAKWVSR